MRLCLISSMIFSSRAIYNRESQWLVVKYYGGNEYNLDASEEILRGKVNGFQDHLLKADDLSWQQTFLVLKIILS